MNNQPLLNLNLFKDLLLLTITFLFYQKNLNFNLLTNSILD